MAIDSAVRTSIPGTLSDDQGLAIKTENLSKSYEMGA
jgi:hypothetical protein